MNRGRVFARGAKRPGREADRSLLTNGEIKIAWFYNWSLFFHGLRRGNVTSPRSTKLRRYIVQKAVRSSNLIDELFLLRKVKKLQKYKTLCKLMTVAQLNYSRMRNAQLEC